MKFLKFLCFMILGATVMFGTLLWMSQFFTGGYDDGARVIWLDTGQERDEPSRPPWLSE